MGVTSVAPCFQKGERMRREIETKLGNKLTLESNAAIPHIYKTIFKKNLFVEFTEMNDKTSDEKTEMIESMVFISAMLAEKPLREVLNMTEVDMLDFLGKYEMFELLDEHIAQTVTEMWSANMETHSQPKNLQSPQ